MSRTCSCYHYTQGTKLSLPDSALKQEVLVQEYIVWQILENKLDWFSLQDGEYVPLAADIDGVIKSQVFPGLWLAVNALLAGEMTQVLTVLQQGINSKEHAEFLRRLSN